MNPRLAAKALAFVLCCAADAFVVRTMWTGRQIADGQIRRGYFERAGGDVTLALDTLIRPTFPSLLLSADGELDVPPGVSTVAPLGPGADYELTCDTRLAPYVVIGVEARLSDTGSPQPLPGEALLAGGRTLSFSDGQLALAPWDATLAWRDDAARLSALHRACREPDGTARLRVQATATRLEVRLGHCSFTEPRPAVGTPLLAALAASDWIRITRRPGWNGESWIVWPVLFAILAKTAATWWGAGIVSALALAMLLLGAAFVVPVAATLTWPLTLALGLAAAVLRLTRMGLRHLPRRWLVPAAVALVGLPAGLLTMRMTQAKPASPPTILHTHEERGQPDACAVVGYSTAGGASLRGSMEQRGLRGIRSFLDRDCARCRDATGAIAGSGETMGWLRDAFCAAPASFGADGQVIFLGGANDDFFWGMTTLARLFVVSQQGIEPWRAGQEPVAAASLARIDQQTAAIDGLVRCVRERRARFLFLHDFLVTDMAAGREPDRETMLARRRAAVEAAGGTFVDLFDNFAAEAGVSWFNDYVHPSLIAHERFADLACPRSP